MHDAQLRDTLRHLPKVSLHDHLDGGLRPQTVIELADEAGWALPTRRPFDLREWFADTASSGSLVDYLQTFDHTVAVLQTQEALARVATEYVLDLAADGVVYAETRWAPEQHLRAGLTPEEAVDAVAAGLQAGMTQAAAQGTPLLVRQLLCALRHGEPSTAVTELAMRHTDDGVVGIDLAGAEAGHPAGDWRDAFALARAAGLHTTVHAGEASGPESIAEALRDCRPERIGHGMRIVDDIDLSGDVPTLGPLARRLVETGLPLETCPSSNVQTGVAGSIGTLPFATLADLGFAVTVNCDNRLQSRTTLTEEFALLSEAFGYGVAAVERFTATAARAAFCTPAEQRHLLYEVIAPAYDAALTGLGERTVPLPLLEAA